MKTRSTTTEHRNAVIVSYFGWHQLCVIVWQRVNIITLLRPNHNRIYVLLLVHCAAPTFSLFFLLSPFSHLCIAVWTYFSRVRRDLSSVFQVPGTKWCGKGYSAKKYAELGGYSKADRCCRQHDKSCPFWIMGFETKYGFFNWRINTLMHCKCDDRYCRIRTLSLFPWLSTRHDFRFLFFSRFFVFVRYFLRVRSGLLIQHSIRCWFYRFCSLTNTHGLVLAVKVVTVMLCRLREDSADLLFLLLFVALQHHGYHVQMRKTRMKWTVDSIDYLLLFWFSYMQNVFEFICSLSGSQAIFFTDDRMVFFCCGFCCVNWCSAVKWGESRKSGTKILLVCAFAIIYNTHTVQSAHWTSEKQGENRNRKNRINYTWAHLMSQSNDLVTVAARSAWSKTLAEKSATIATIARSFSVSSQHDCEYCRTNGKWQMATQYKSLTPFRFNGFCCVNTCEWNRPLRWP